MDIQPIMKLSLDPEYDYHYPDETRLETGVVQIQGDWPGIFLRGDDAFKLAMTIDSVLSDCIGDKSIYATMLENTANMLRECIQQNDPLGVSKR